MVWGWFENGLGMVWEWFWDGLGMVFGPVIDEFFRGEAVILSQALRRPPTDKGINNDPHVVISGLYVL